MRMMEISILVDKAGNFFRRQDRSPGCNIEVYSDGESGVFLMYPDQGLTGPG
jgi:hypothetical protein